MCEVLAMYLTFNLTTFPMELFGDSSDVFERLLVSIDLVKLSPRCCALGRRDDLKLLVSGQAVVIETVFERVSAVVQNFFCSPTGA